MSSPPSARGPGPQMIIGSDVGRHNTGEASVERIVRGRLRHDLSTICLTVTYGAIDVRVVESWFQMLTPMNQRVWRMFVRGTGPRGRSQRRDRAHPGRPRAGGYEISAHPRGGQPPAPTRAAQAVLRASMSTPPSAGRSGHPRARLPRRVRPPRQGRPLRYEHGSRVVTQVERLLGMWTPVAHPPAMSNSSS
jgi:hypothetical protein